jgi:hypothetical protein
LLDKPSRQFAKNSADVTQRKVFSVPDARPTVVLADRGTFGKQF